MNFRKSIILLSVPQKAQMGVGGDDSWGSYTHPEYLLDTDKKNGIFFCIQRTLNVIKKQNIKAEKKLPETIRKLFIS